MEVYLGQVVIPDAGRWWLTAVKDDVGLKAVDASHAGVECVVPAFSCSRYIRICDSSRH